MPNKWGYERAIVVGASSGIGLEIARLLATDGCRVAAVARRADRLRKLAEEFPKQVLAFEHDVTQFGATRSLFQEITRQLGGLDLVVYAAGAMLPVGREEFDFEKDQAMFAINVLGCIAWMNEAADRFQGVGAGTLLAIGSVAGDRGRAAQPGYNSSKAALATYMEALRNRLAKKGVRVVTIKPGPTRTEMTAHLDTSKMMSPEAVARIALTKSRRTGEHYVKLTHAILFAVVKHIPSWIFRRLKL